MDSFDEYDDTWFPYPAALQEKTSPLDYDRTEAAGYWDRMIPHNGKRNTISPRFVSEFIWKSPQFYSFFNLLYQRLDESFMTDTLGPFDDLEENEAKKYVIAIPCETEPFFRDYLAAITSYPDYKLRFSSEADPPAFPQNFGQIFLEQARNTIEDDPEKLEFYEHSLYMNPVFCSFAVDDFWKREIETRGQILKDLINKLPIEDRIDRLRKVIAALDNAIVSFDGDLTKTPEETTTAFIKGFPYQQLRAVRQTDSIENTSPKNDWPVYENVYAFPHIPVSISLDGKRKCLDLEEIFNAIKAEEARPAKEYAAKDYTLIKQERIRQYREPARDAYLRYLSEISEKGQFQIQYETLEQYTAQVNTSFDQAAVESWASLVAQQYIRGLWKNLFCPGFIELPDNPYSYASLLGHFLADRVQEFENSTSVELDYLQVFRNQFHPGNLPLEEPDLPGDSKQLFFYLFHRNVGMEWQEACIAFGWQYKPKDCVFQELKQMYLAALAMLEEDVDTSFHSQVYRQALLDWADQYCDQQVLKTYLIYGGAVAPHYGTALHAVLFALKLAMKYQQIVSEAVSWCRQYHSRLNQIYREQT